MSGPPTIIGCAKSGALNKVTKHTITEYFDNVVQTLKSHLGNLGPNNEE